MAVPKKRVSRTRRDKRRSNVWKLEAPAFSRCNNCGELKLSHRICGSCGYYKGVEVIKQEEAAAVSG
jgi:large subunit ribosomal protein L32